MYVAANDRYRLFCIYLLATLCIACDLPLLLGKITNIEFFIFLEALHYSSLAAYKYCYSH